MAIFCYAISLKCNIVNGSIKYTTVRSHASGAAWPKSCAVVSLISTIAIA